jgi:DNA-binding beta-propeller fold protein YncE
MKKNNCFTYALILSFGLISQSCGKKSSSATGSCLEFGQSTCALNLTGQVTTLAGAGVNSEADGIGTAAKFSYPIGITTDGTNLYVVDNHANKIRKIVISTGAVTTFAGSGTSGEVDGTGTAAEFNSPSGITTDGTNLYVTDYTGGTIRKIVISTGVVTTLAGTAGSLTERDGTGTAAAFNDPAGITTDGTNLYVADAVGNTIRKIVISTGVVTTLAGSGSTADADGTGTAAAFDAPLAVVTDGTNLYVADRNNNKIRKIVLSTAVVTTLAGSGSSTDADGTGTAASIDAPIGITMDGTNLYVADGGNLIRKIVISTGVVTTLAGSGLFAETDGTGTAASLNTPSAFTSDGSSLYVTDEDGFTIRKIQ